MTFPVKDDTALVAWTTTPWTLPSNMALAVNPHLVYAKVKDLESQKFFILLKELVEGFYKIIGGEYQLVEEFKGSELQSLSYEPLFEYYGHLRETGCFRVYCAEFVTADTGTGVVHCAPAFGEDDFNLCCIKNKIVQ